MSKKNMLNGCLNFFEETKHMTFILEANHKIIIDKHNEIWNKVKSIIKNVFHTEPVHYTKYLKTKIKS